MILQSVWQKCFDFLPGKPIFVQPVAAALTSDAGLLPIRQFDEQLGFTAQFVNALEDPRSPRQGKLNGTGLIIDDWRGVE